MGKREWRGRLLVWGLLGMAMLCSSPAGARPLVSLRFASVEAVLEAGEKVAEAAGRPFDGRALLTRTLAQVGVADPTVLDTTRPVTAVLPVEGMLLQQRGVVAAVPVRSAAAALDAMAASLPGRAKEGELHVFRDPSGSSLYVAEKGAYLVVGQTRDFVGRFDVAALSRPWGGPSGQVQLEIFLEPLLPLLQAGLVSARETLKNEIQEQLEQPRSAPLEEPAPDGGAVAELVDLYLDTLQVLLKDLSRLQAAVEVSEDHIFYRQRAVPKPGTATAEFVAAQQGRLSALGRSVPPGAFHMAGRVLLTPRLEAGLKAFAGRYARGMERLLREMKQAGGAEAGSRTDFELLAAYLAVSEEWMADGLACFAGDFAAGMDFSGKDGVGSSQVVRYRETETCRRIIEDSLRHLASLVSEGDGGANIPVERTEVAGTPARRFTLDMDAFLKNADPDERRMLERLYGGPKVEHYVALKEGAIYYATGQSARERLGALLTGKEAKRGGVTAASFTPLSPGPGLFFAVESSRVLALARDMVDASDPERARLAGLSERLSGAAGRVVSALRFEPAGSTFALAFPLKMLGAAQAVPLSPPEPAEKGTGGEDNEGAE